MWSADQDLPAVTSAEHQVVTFGNKFWVVVIGSRPGSGPGRKGLLDTWRETTYFFQGQGGQENYPASGGPKGLSAPQPGHMRGLSREEVRGKLLPGRGMAENLPRR